MATGLVVLFLVGARWYRAEQAATALQAASTQEAAATTQRPEALSASMSATQAPAVPAAPGEAASTGQPLLVRPHSPTLGAANARVSIVEFFDPECEACRAMYPIVKDVMKEFDGQAKLVIRYMPNHPNSRSAAALLEAAREQNKYWEYLEIMMFRQPEWASHHAPRPELLLAYAAEVGLDVKRLQADAMRADIRARIEADQSDGLALGARQTPTFFINGKPLMQLGHEPLRGAVQAALR